jgi:hypothetical protein
MEKDRKRQALAVVAVAAGVALIGTSGAAFVAGWGLWAAGLVALVSAVQTEAPSVQRGMPVVKSVRTSRP